MLGARHSRELKSGWEQEEKKKCWSGFTDLKYWGMGILVRYAEEVVFGKLCRPKAGGNLG